ncbi:unnamed protein product, partial [Porites lobata]
MQRRIAAVCIAFAFAAVVTLTKSTNVLKRDNYEHAHYGNFKGFFNYALNISNRLVSLNSPCENSPCKNNGKCVSLYKENSYVCLCSDGFFGINCEKVHWKQMTTSPVCFGASADSFGHFVTPIAGDLLSFKLIHQSGSVECSAGRSSHWGCTHPVLPQDHQLGTIITSSLSERLLPKDDFFLEGIDCHNTFYGLPGQTADSPELLFDNFSTPLHVS